VRALPVLIVAVFEFGGPARALIAHPPSVTSGTASLAVLESPGSTAGLTQVVAEIT
jgi:hypothetical protein